MADREGLMEAALEVYPEGLALLDEDGRVVLWNRAAEAITGYARAGVVGARCRGRWNRWWIAGTWRARRNRVTDHNQGGGRWCMRSTRRGKTWRRSAGR